MGKLSEKVFLHFWPKCFIVFMAVIELLCALILFLTELCNVAANFWITNVFAGGWCGLIILLHTILVFISGCCSPGSKPAYRAVVVGVIGLIATAALISFDATFLAQPTICVLTSSCAQNAVSNTTFSYGFSQSFYTVFNSWGPFSSYQQNNVKLLCQAMQVGIGGLSFLICLIYMIIYYMIASKSRKIVEPSPIPPQAYYPPQPYYPPPLPAQPPAAQGYYPSPPPLPPAQQSYFQTLPSQPYYQPPVPAWRPPPQGPPIANPGYY